MIKLCILETKIFIVCYILNFIKDRIKFTFMDIRLFIVYSSTYTFIMDNDGYGFETKQGKNDDKKVSFTDFEQRA